MRIVFLLKKNATVHQHMFALICTGLLTFNISKDKTGIFFWKANTNVNYFKNELFDILHIIINNYNNGEFMTFI